MKNNTLVQNITLGGGLLLSKINPSYFSYALKR